MMADYQPWFPKGTVHCAVVDPGVGTARRILAADIGGAHYVLPDNGLITELARRGHVQRVIAVNLERFRATASATFHGRDIIAPVAAEIAQGTLLPELGPTIRDWVQLPGLIAHAEADGWHGHVWLADRFGNLLTTIRREQLAGESVQVHVAGRTISGLQTTYGDRPPGELIALFGSSNFLEVAVVQGSAADVLGVGPGTPVTAFALSAP
jgi:S-adenosylmethionine hydrolase